MLITPGHFIVLRTLHSYQRVWALDSYLREDGVASLSLVQPPGFSSTVPSDCSHPPLSG